MSDLDTAPSAPPAPPAATAVLEPPEGVGQFDAEGNYIPRQIVDQDIEDQFLDDAYTATMVQVEDGQIVSGKVVKVDRDEVLLDIGYKSEGIIPTRELSIRNVIDPGEIVTLGEVIEALVLQKEDKDGHLILSKKRAQYERAWGNIEDVKENEGTVSGPVIEVVKGGLILDIGLRGFLPASLVELRRVRDLQPYIGQTLEAKIIELDKNRNNVVLSRRAWLGGDRERAARGLLGQPQAGGAPQRRGVVCGEFWRIRRLGRHGRPGSRVGAVVEARRPPQCSCSGGRRD